MHISLKKETIIFCMMAFSVCANAESLDLVADGFIQPMVVTTRSTDDKLFVAEKGGLIYSVDKLTGVKTQFLDISDKVDVQGERGLLGFTFDPNFSSNGKFYVNYSEKNTFDNIIASYKVSTSNNLIADTNENRIMRIDQPENSSHKAGWIGFRPGEANNLYIATGDGVYAGNSLAGADPGDDAQDLSSNLGKILRIDVSSDSFAVPAGNAAEVLNTNANPEVWAYGLRNPFRNSFDSLTGDLWIADVGFTQFDEVNLLKNGTGAGANLGWDFKEGNDYLDPNNPANPLPSNLVDPIFTSAVGNGSAIIGGLVYRGPIDSLFGTYIYAEFVSGSIRSFRYENGSVTDQQDWTQSWLAQYGYVATSSFGEDSLGNLYLTDLVGGRLFALNPNPVPLPATWLLFGSAIPFIARTRRNKKL